MSIDSESVLYLFYAIYNKNIEKKDIKRYDRGETEFTEDSFHNVTY